ncbi:MAG: hypothetical protein ACXWRZ_14495, partial [Bdellovibrio sp.]
MKKLTVTLLSILAAATMISACARKSSDFAERYARNRMGAQVIDGPKTQQAAEQAAAQGLTAVDIVDIKKYWTSANEPGPRFVTAVILIDDQQTTVTTNHYGSNVAEGYVDIKGYRIVYHAVCANEECNPYYSSLEVFQNNKMLIQEGVMKYFNTGDTQNDYYQWFQPSEALPLV